MREQLPRVQRVPRDRGHRVRAKLRQGKSLTAMKIPAFERNKRAMPTASKSRAKIIV